MEIHSSLTVNLMEKASQVWRMGDKPVNSLFLGLKYIIT